MIKDWALASKFLNHSGGADANTAARLAIAAGDVATSSSDEGTAVSCRASEDGGGAFSKDSMEAREERALEMMVAFVLLKIGASRAQVNVVIPGRRAPNKIGHRILD